MNKRATMHRLNNKNITINNTKSLKSSSIQIHNFFQNFNKNPLIGVTNFDRLLFQLPLGKSCAEQNISYARA